MLPPGSVEMRVIHSLQMRQQGSKGQSPIIHSYKNNNPVFCLRGPASIKNRKAKCRKISTRCADENPSRLSRQQKVSVAPGRLVLLSLLRHLPGSCTGVTFSSGAFQSCILLVQSAGIHRGWCFPQWELLVALILQTFSTTLDIFLKNVWNLHELYKDFTIECWGGHCLQHLDISGHCSIVWQSPQVNSFASCFGCAYKLHKSL